MFTSSVNQMLFAPTSKPVKSRITTIEIGTVFPSSGESRSLPAEIGGTGGSLKTRAPRAKEHPVEPSISASPFEPEREPENGSSLAPVSPI